MGQPAARVTDMHVCPMFDGPKPHVGGPIIPPCLPTVLIGGLPAARVTDMATCVGPPDVIVKGSLGVMIGGLPAARMGDLTAHGGVITTGLPTVLIGDLAPGTPSPPSPPRPAAPETGGWLDGLHAVLDVAGMIPIVGNVADAANAAIYAAEGDFGNAALSAAAMVPGLGQAATAGKLGARAAKTSKRLTPAKIRAYLKGVKDKPQAKIADDLEAIGFRKIGPVGPKGNERMYHFKDDRGRFIRLDPPQGKTNYPHMHIRDSKGRNLNADLKPVSGKSPEAHIETGKGFDPPQ